MRPLDIFEPLFLFTCSYQKLHLNPAPQLAKETDRLWNWDVAEVFLGSDQTNIRRYKEFEVSPQSEWIDIDVDLDTPNHVYCWTSGIQAAACINSAAMVW